MMRSLYLCLCLVLILSGCITDQKPPVEEVPATKVADGDLNLPLSVPIVINKTVDPAGFGIVNIMNQNCPITVRPTIHLRLMDRFGLVHEAVVPIDMNATANIWVPVSGSPPWLLVGDGNPCSASMASHLTGVEQGYKVHLEHPGTREKRNESVWINLTKGERSASATWRGEGDDLFSMFHAHPFVREGRSGLQGKLEMVYPDGAVWRWDEFYLTGSSDTDFRGIQYYPGDYTIRFETTAAVVSDVSFEYRIMVMRLHEKICTHGFEWEMCKKG